jgi:integrase
LVIWQIFAKTHCRTTNAALACFYPHVATYVLSKGGIGGRVPKLKLTKRSVESAQPAEKDVILWDTELTGFACKITPSGRRSYFCYYRTRDGQQRRPSIGQHGHVTCDEARAIARETLADVVRGYDPSAIRRESRQAPTMAEFAERYLNEHAYPKKKPLSVQADERNLRNHVLPALGTRRITEVTRGDVFRFQHSLNDKPGAANRCMALLSKMFNLAEAWGLRPDNTNPCRHLEKYRERKIERFLSAEELARMGGALSRAERSPKLRSAVAAIRLLTFTGCRRDEILTLQWRHVDLEQRLLRLPDSKTGAKLVRLSPPAILILKSLDRSGDPEFVIPGTKHNSHLVGIGKIWHRIREDAGLSDVRLHDLRHSFASMGAATGMGLPVIGALLGHKDAATTQRYAHLGPDPLQAANDALGSHIADAMNSGRVASSD